MPVRKARLRKDTDTDDTPAARCAACANQDPVRRHQHYLALGRTLPLAAVERHLTSEKARIVKDPVRLTDYVQADLRWIQDQLNNPLLRQG